MNARGCTVLSLLGVLVWSGSGERTASIPWQTDEALAREEAGRSGRQILVDAWADWCAGCKLLDRNTWSDRRVQDEVRARFVALRVDLSAEGTDAELRLRALGVSALPAVLLCPVSACDAGARRLVGYVGPDEMLAFLRD
jgi:thiol:disulfide interchange protein